MKKIIFTIFFTFLFILQISAADKFYIGEKVPDMYIESKNGNDLHNGAPFLLTRADGKLVYCIDPFKMMDTNNYYNSFTYNNSIFKLSNEALNKMNIIAYYGYGYSNHTDLKWYGITQFLIYKALGIESVYFTDVYYGNRVDKYTNEVKELENLVSNYYKLPSFASKTYEYEPNKTYEISDINNILNNYEISYSNINANINNNKLVINTSKSGTYIVEFVRKSPINTNYILYSLEGAQSLFYPGKINDITFNLNITVNSGSITINKYDIENKDRLEANIVGSTFGIYKDNELIKKLIIGNTGTSSVDELPLGNYVIKELIPSKGYNLDSKEYNITLTKENRDIVINSYSNVIKGTLKINKYYGSDNEYRLDEDAVFEIYNNDKLIKTVSGRVIENLEYGTYYIKQTKGKKYYDVIKDFNVSILEEKDYIYNFYTEKTDEIKAYEEILNKREQSLNQKEEELKAMEDKLKKEKDDLNNLKDEIKSKQDEVDGEKQELNKIKEEINTRETELKELENNINKEKEELKELEKKINREKEELKELENNINKEKEEIEQKKDEIKRNYVLLNEKTKELENKEIELNKLKEELMTLKNDILKKEQELCELDKILNNKKQDLTKKEQNIEKLDILIVEVPDTYKKSNAYSISKKLIVLGISIIVISVLKKKKIKV